MNKLQIMRFQKHFHQWTSHVVSFDFGKTPDEIKREIDDFSNIMNIPIVRLDDSRQLCINESDPNWENLKKLFVALDTLPEIVLRDLYETYLEKHAAGGCLRVVACRMRRFPDALSRG